MKRRPIVWCGSNKGYDLSAAEVYGDVNIIYPDRPKNVFSTSTHAFHIKEALKDAEASDYILVTGNLVLVLIMFAVMYERFSYVNLLLYDLRSQEYVPRVLPRHQVQSNRKE
jgi:hypothetical protein